MSCRPENRRKKCQDRSTSKKHHGNRQYISADQYHSFVGLGNLMKAFAQNKHSASQKCFRTSQDAINHPKCHNDQDEAEKYLRCRLQLFSDNLHSESLKILHIQATEMYPILTKCCGTNSPLIKQS